MARLDQMPEPMRSHLAALPCPTFAVHPWVAGPPLRQRRVAIISTAGLHRRSDRPFAGVPYRKTFPDLPEPDAEVAAAGDPAF